MDNELLQLMKFLLFTERKIVGYTDMMLTEDNIGTEKRFLKEYRII